MLKRPYIYAIGGGLLSLFDSIFFHLIGVQMHIDGLNVMPFLAAFFCINFAIMGFFFGSLKEAKLLLEERAQALALSKETELVALQKSMDLEHLAALGRMSASIAHEVRNPLGVMRASAEIISDDVTEMPETQTAAHFIRDEVDRLNDFVGTLLNYARPIQVQLQPCTTTHLAERLDALIHDQRLQANWPKSPISLNTDPELIVRILHNILLNALHFIDTNTGTVSLHVTQKDTNTILNIQDNGPGVPAEHHDDLFEPFFTTRTRGTGLGLATSMRLSDALEAKLQYHPGATGAHFSLTL